MAEANTSVGDVQPALRRVMGPKLLLLFIIGDILGTGIYALVGQVAEEVFALITYVSLGTGSDVVAELGGTTALLLLAVFSLVNVAVLVLRKNKVDAKHFKAPPGLPIVGAIACLYLVLPFSGRATIQYELAGMLLLLGLILYGVTVLLNRRLGVKQTTLDPSKFDG